MTRNRLPKGPPPGLVDTIRRVLDTRVCQDLLRSAVDAKPPQPVAMMMLHPDTHMHRMLSAELLAEDAAYWGAELAEQAKVMRSIGLPPLALIPLPSQVLVRLLDQLAQDDAQREAWRDQVQRERCVVCLADAEGMLVLPLSSRTNGVN